MRTLTPALESHLAGRAHTRATMLLIAKRNGTYLGVTDHDRDISYNLLGDTVTYRADTGILTSDVSLSTGLETDNYEVTGPIGDAVTLEEILGGTYNRARGYLFQINWKAPADGVIKLLATNISEARVEGGKFVFEMRSHVDRFNQVVGTVITNQCQADFGDEDCGVVPESITGTVTAATNGLQFTVSFAGTYADDYFNLGKVTPLTGVNAGTDKIEVFDWTSAGVVTLFSPLVATPAVGDTFTIEVGCTKARLSDDPTQRTCKFYNNVANFVRGFPDVTGSDQVMRATIPGEG